MKKYIFIFISLIFFGCSEELQDSQSDVQEQINNEDIMDIKTLQLHEDKIHYEYDDLLLTERQADLLLNYRGSEKGASSRFFNRWNNCTVYYKWSSSKPPSSNAKNAFIQAFREIENATNVDFKYAAWSAPRSSYLEVKKTNGGPAATVGKTSRSTLYLPTTGFSIRDIRHEVGHVLGLVHEHQRSDAANFLTYQLGNLDGCSSSYFTPKGIYSTRYTAFDDRSVMIYHSCACSDTGGLAGGCSAANAVYVRRANNSIINTNLPNVQGYSAGDIASIRAIYNNCGGGNPPGGGGAEE